MYTNVATYDDKALGAVINPAYDYKRFQKIAFYPPMSFVFQDKRFV